MATFDLAAARALHDEVAAIDLHADTPKIMRAFAYDLGVRHEPPLPGARYLGHVDVPRMREGGLAAQIFGLWTFPYPRAGCAASVDGQLDALAAAAAAHPDDLALCRTAGEVEAARRAGRIAALAGIEGGHALEGRLDRVEAFARRGVRYLGLLHFTRNDLGCPAKGVGRDDAQGLTPFGRQVVEEMDRVGMIVDLAHINRRGFFEALAATRAVPIVSHTGVAGVWRHWRNLDDEQVRAVAAHLAHVAQVGGEDAPALGSDYDGMVRPPRGLEDVSMLPRLTAALLARGMGQGAHYSLKERGIRPVLTDIQDMQAAVEAYLSGKLIENLGRLH